MEASNRIEQTLEAAVTRAEDEAAPPKLAQAVRYAVFPGGARVRPKLCLAVAAACGDDDPAAANGAAAALELMHCASLVHDDMPCFDDADLRRGKPTVHAKFGEPLALLAGDALIVAAFDVLARGAAGAPGRLGAMVGALSRATGMPGGIVAGQGWESESALDLAAYHRAKTGSLFVGAATLGALSAGADPAAWRPLGERLGEAFQVADDILDASGSVEAIGKPIGQDAVHDRPNAVARLGLDGAVERLRSLIEAAVAAIPPCDGAGALKDLVRLQAKRLGPGAADRSAA